MSKRKDKSRPLTADEIDLLFATTHDVADALGRAMVEVVKVTESLQAEPETNGQEPTI